MTITGTYIMVIDVILDGILQFVPGIKTASKNHDTVIVIIKIERDERLLLNFAIRHSAA